ncbi:DUF5994 family protein [Streptomyces sp. URMC 129]|uniref:DUF5994 family protein n=1 Tax=Streptomyces sp. URMC 129 TaxID=3423407 RepID=UPI003F19F454
MTVTEYLAPPSPPPPPADDLPARLTLLPPGTGPHRLDGTWWPRSHDLGRELPALLAALEEHWPGITRVTVSRSMWRVRPDSLSLGDRAVHINRSEATPTPHTVCLLSYGVGRCDLLVIPPGAPASAAAGPATAPAPAAAHAPAEA